MGSTPVNGTGNSFPQGQCTSWASERYHQLTGYWIPWSGNANQWKVNAEYYGWTVQDGPAVAPSIICLQAGVQGASSPDGHVGIVESINTDGSVTTSDLNWGLTAEERAAVSSVTFKPGAGVSFIYAPGATVISSSTNSQTAAASVGSDLANLASAAINAIPVPGVAGVLNAITALPAGQTVLEIIGAAMIIGGLALVAGLFYFMQRM